MDYISLFFLAVAAFIIGYRIKRLAKDTRESTAAPSVGWVVRAGLVSTYAVIALSVLMMIFLYFSVYEGRAYILFMIAGLSLAATTVASLTIWRLMERKLIS